MGQVSTYRSGTFSGSRLILLLAALSMCLLSGCSSINSMMGGNTAKQALAEIKYTADPRGVVMDIHASAMLNYVNGVPHTVALAVIQSNNPKAMLKLSSSVSDLDRLLNGVAPTDPAILSVDRFVVQPGAIDTIVLARRQEAQTVLVYAGYFNSPVSQRVRMLEVPVAVTSDGVFVTTYSAGPAAMHMSLDLSEVMIEDLKLMGPTPFVFPNPDNTTLQGGRPKLDPTGDKVMPL